MTNCVECGRECKFPWYYADTKSTTYFVDIEDNNTNRIILHGNTTTLYFCSKEHRQVYFEYNFPETMD